MTHTTKHTPGPWKAVQHTREHKWAWTIEGADGVGQSIARIGLVNDAQAVAANANLIAAAPAMYLELVKQRDWLLHIMGEVQCSPSIKMGLEQSIKYLNIMIAQAEGRDK